MPFFATLKIKKRRHWFLKTVKKVSFKSGDKTPLNWTTIVIPNKYPAFSPGEDLDKRTEGNLFQAINAVGFHEVIITKNHKKQLAQFSDEEFKEVIDVYQERYLDLKGKNSLIIFLFFIIMAEGPELRCLTPFPAYHHALG